MLCQHQIHYAALDAWVALQMYDALQANRSVGEPLCSLTPIGQPISHHIQRQKVAPGIIVQQPAQFTLSPATDNSPAGCPHSSCPTIPHLHQRSSLSH